MGIIIALSINWLAAGACVGFGIASLLDKQYKLAIFNAGLFLFNAILGTINISRLLAIVQFVAESIK